METERVYEKGNRPEASTAREVFELMKDIKDNAQELFLVLCMDSRNNVISRNILTIGTLNSSIVHPRDVFRVAILSNSCSLVLSHTHPSGNSKPSKDDLLITKKVVQAGKIMGIPILDHVVVGTDYYSMAEKHVGGL